MCFMASYLCVLTKICIVPRSGSLPAKIWIATWSGLRGATYHHYQQPSTILYCGSGRRWGAAGLKNSSPPLPSTAQNSLDIPESSVPQHCGVIHNERIRSPTRVEVDSSLYLEAPDEAPPPAKRFNFISYLLFAALANTSFVFIKKKLMEDSDENYVDLLVFLGLVNLGLVIIFFIFPVMASSDSSCCSALSKPQEGPLEVTVPPPPQPPAPPREREAPPPPYHIAVETSTPPPSYFDIYDK